VFKHQLGVIKTIESAPYFPALLSPNNDLNPTLLCVHGPFLSPQPALTCGPTDLCQLYYKHYNVKWWVLIRITYTVQDILKTNAKLPVTWVPFGEGGKGALAPTKTCTTLSHYNFVSLKGGPIRPHTPLLGFAISKTTRDIFMQQLARERS